MASHSRQDTISGAHDASRKRLYGWIAVWVVLVAALLQPTTIPWVAVFVGLSLATLAAMRHRFGLALVALPLGILAYLLSAGIAYTLLIPIGDAITVTAWQRLPVILPIIVATVITVLWWRRRKGYGLGASLVSMAWLVAFGLSAVGWYSNVDTRIVEWQMRRFLAPEAMAELPDTINNRLVPRSTAHEFIQNANEDNTLVPDPPILVVHGDQLCWQSSLFLDVWYGHIFGTVQQVIRIDAGDVDMKVVAKSAGDEAFFLMSHHSWIVRTAFQLHHPFSELGETVYWLKDDGSWVLLFSYVSWWPTVSGTMVPYLAGVMEVSRWGWINNHSVEDAAKLFRNAPFYPPDLARSYADAYGKWRGGIWSQAVTRKDILEVSEDVAADPGANRFPYLQDLSGIGLQEVIPLEPAGFGGYALKELLFIDATTGEARVYRVPQNPPVNGPRKSIQYIRKADPNAYWGERRTVEPRLVVRQGKIYWLPSLILDEPTPAGPKAAAYIMSVLVDAVSLKSYLLVGGSDLARLLDSLQAGKSPEVTNAEAAPM